MNNLLTLCWICHRRVHDRKLWIEVVKQLPNDLVVRFMEDYVRTQLSDEG